MRTMNEITPRGGLHPDQRIQLSALIERCARDQAQVIAQRFAAGRIKLNGSFVATRGLGRFSGEPQGGVAVFATPAVLIFAVNCLRVQQFVDLLPARRLKGELRRA